MTQDSINATKLILVKNIYLQYVFILSLTHHSCQNSSRCFCFRAAQRGITDAKPTFDKISWLGLPGLNNLFYVSKTSLNCSLLQRLLKLLLWGAQQRISCCRGSCSRKLKGSKLQNKSAGLSSKEEKGFFCGDRPLFKLQSQTAGVQQQILRCGRSLAV